MKQDTHTIFDGINITFLLFLRITLINEHTRHALADLISLGIESSDIVKQSNESKTI